MQYLRFLGASLLLVCSHASAARTNHFNQVFYLDAAIIASDVTVKNVGGLPQTVCVSGGVYRRLTGTPLGPPSVLPELPGQPLCPFFINDLQTGSTEKTVSGERECVTINGGAMTNWNIRKTRTTHCNYVDAGVVEVLVKVLEDRGAVSGSFFITQFNTQKATQGYVQLNGGRPF